MSSKFKLTDCTFIIPFMIDSRERFENLECVVRFLNNSFETNFILVESGPKSFYFDLPNVKAQHFFVREDSFHRTKMINTGIKLAKTPYVAIYDTDVVFDVHNILQAAGMLRTDPNVILTYPYSGNFKNISRDYIKTGNVVTTSDSYVVDSYGGACFLNKREYLKCGLDNENLMGAHCPDDHERALRVQRLGYGIGRVTGDCFHISHPVSKDSHSNPYASANSVELVKTKTYTKEQLQNYIETWEWIK